MMDKLMELVPPLKLCEGAQVGPTVFRWFEDSFAETRVRRYGVEGDVELAPAPTLAEILAAMTEPQRVAFAERLKLCTDTPREITRYAMQIYRGGKG